MPDWSAPDIVAWFERARDTQQCNCDRLSDRDYDSYVGEEKKYLLLKIAYALFGSPSTVDENDEVVKITAFTQEQQKSANRIYEQVIKYSGEELQAAFIFLMVKEHEHEYQVPLIRFVASKHYSKAEYFLDHYGRVYQSWNDFDKWNELPKCLYCFPSNGWYKTDSKGRVDVGKTTSPRCNVGERTVEIADIASGVAAVGSVFLLGAGILFPPAAPICIPAATGLGTSSGAYAVGRNTTKLVDRAVHGQSINPIDDAEARNCWLGGVGGALGLGTVGTARYITYLAQEGDVASKVLRVTFNILETSSLTVNGFGIVCNIVELSKKEKVTTMDVANLSLNVLFFTHSVMNLQTARTLIKDTQKQVINTSKGAMDRDAQASFRAFLKQNKKETHSTMYGNAKTIKGLKKIDNPQQFFSDLQQVRVDAKAGNARNLKVRVNNDMLVSINGELKLHPSKWCTVNEESRRQLLDCARKIKTNPESALIYIDEVKRICSKERLAFERTRQATVRLLAEKFRVRDAASIKIGGKRVFENLRPHEIDRIGYMLEANKKHATEEFVQCVTELAKNVGCESSGEYFGLFEYCLTHIKEVRNNATIPEVVHELNTSPAAKQRLLEKFRGDRVVVGGLNQSSSPAFANDTLATYHYHKHKALGPRGEVPPEQYFEILRDMTGRTDRRTSTNITQEGNKVIVTFINPDDGLKCITVEPLLNVGDDCVIAATLFYDKRLHLNH